MLDQGSFYQQKMPYKNDENLCSQFWNTIFGPNGPNTQVTNLHPSSTTTIHRPIPTGIRPEAQIGPLLSGYLLRSSLVNWAKAPATNSSKSLGHVPAGSGHRGASVLEGLRFTKKRLKHTKVTMESQHALLANRM